MKKQYIKICNRRVDKNHPVFIIAEAGVNHNGSLKLAKKMIDAAKFAGADAVKFQTFSAENVLSKSAPKAKYQKETTDPIESQFEMIKKLELNEDAHYELKGYADKKKMMFISTPFDFQSADLLDKLEVELFKISSGEITNIPLITHVAKKRKPIILSTGMSYLGEVKEAIEAIEKEGCNKIILLHCTSNYPAKYQDINLRAMQTLGDTFKLAVGYSDHSLGIEVAIAAVALGAKVIEKHFTLDKNLPGPDHKTSLNPSELAVLVESIRNIELALGSKEKKPVVAENEMRRIARKSLIAMSHFNIGDTISIEKVAIKRPGTGIGPKYLHQIIGRKVKKKIGKDQIITWDDLI